MARTTIRSEDISAGAIDTTNLETDIALLGFKVAANGSLAAYGLSKQTIDAFEDSSGIDAGTSSNEIVENSYVTGKSAGNYFGNSELGTVQFGASSITQSSHSVGIDTKLSVGTSSSGPGNSSYGGWSAASRNKEVPVPNNTAVYEATVTNGGSSITSSSGSSSGGSINTDGDMVVLQFDTLTIDASTTLTTNHPCRGLFVYVENDCTINGSLSMNSRGANADPTISGGSDNAAVNANGIQLPMLTSGGTSTLASATFSGTGSTAVSAVANQTGISGNGTIFSIARTGAAGGAGQTGQGGGNAGSDGTTGASTISTGGGGSGGTTYDNNVNPNTSIGGDGGSGSCFSGGAGGGGTYNNNNSTYYTGGDGSSTGGAGGNGFGNASAYAAGGAGNGGGTGVSASLEGSDGTGGIIWLVVGGNLTIGSGGSIDVRGQGHNSSNMGGGASGGGAAMILYAGTFTNNGSINTAAAEARSWPSIIVDGGAAGSNTSQVTGAPQNLNLTLVSNASTADVAPDKADIVMTYTNGAGTATINTDLKAYASRDNGTTWTQATLVADGTSGGHSILVAHNIDISSQPSGTSMKYKIETLNQSASKETRIQAVSLGWK